MLFLRDYSRRWIVLPLCPIPHFKEAWTAVGVVNSLNEEKRKILANEQDRETLEPGEFSAGLMG